MNKTELIGSENQVLNVFCVTTFPSQKNMDCMLTDDTSLVQIISNYIAALNFSKKTVVLLHKLIHDYIIKA